jgi:hypothetical protein
MRRVLVALAALTAAAAGVASTGESSSGPGSAAGCGHWGSKLQGPPARLRRDAPSYSVWHDHRGWHLRTVTPARHRSVLFSGTISTSRALGAVHAFRRERDDSIVAGRRSISFRFRTRGGEVDGVDFSVRCGAVAFTLQRGSRLVYLGTGQQPSPRRFTAADPAASGVQGRVVVGPTCPVEGAGQDCSPRPTQATVDVFTASPSRSDPQGRTSVKTFATDASGQFRVELPSGDYDLTARNPSSAPYPSGRPERVTVTPGVFTNVTLTLDSGIR